jgi:hypothetical protein
MRTFNEDLQPHNPSFHHFFLGKEAFELAASRVAESSSGISLAVEKLVTNDS